MSTLGHHLQLLQFVTLKIHHNTQGLIFDLDGTLADTIPMHKQAWVIAGKKHNVTIDPVWIDELSGIPTFQLVHIFNDRYGWSIDAHAFEVDKDEAYRQILAENGSIRPIDYVVSIVKEHFGKLPMAVGTGSARVDADRAISDLGLGHFFKAVITADDVMEPKPHPETFLRGAEALQIHPSQCQVFEDGPMGIKAALDGGFKVTNVLTGEMHSELF